MKTLGVKISIIVLKFMPVIAAFLMLSHVSFLIFNNLGKARITETTDWTISLPVVPAATAIILSKQLGFCSIHRHMIVYTSIMSYCIKFQKDIGFGVMLMPMRWIMLVSGVILFIVLIRHVITHKIRLFSYGIDRANKGAVN